MQCFGGLFDHTPVSHGLSGDWDIILLFFVEYLELCMEASYIYDTTDIPQQHRDKNKMVS